MGQQRRRVRWSLSSVSITLPPPWLALPVGRLPDSRTNCRSTGLRVAQHIGLYRLVVLTAWLETAWRPGLTLLSSSSGYKSRPEELTASGDTE